MIFNIRKRIFLCILVLSIFSFFITNSIIYNANRTNININNGNNNSIIAGVSDLINIAYDNINTDIVISEHITNIVTSSYEEDIIYQNDLEDYNQCDGPTDQSLIEGYAAKDKIIIYEELSEDSHILTNLTFNTQFYYYKYNDTWTSVLFHDTASDVFLQGYTKINNIMSEKYVSKKIKISSTAYTASSKAKTADGTHPYYGILAGRPSWLHKKCNLYYCNKDGSVGSLIGTFEFRDTGYGQSTGKGSSKILKGKSVGTIENGTCIDIYMDSKSQCFSWGRRNVFLEFID